MKVTLEEGKSPSKLTLIPGNIYKYVYKDESTYCIGVTKRIGNYFDYKLCFVPIHFDPQPLQMGELIWDNLDEVLLNKNGTFGHFEPFHGKLILENA